MPSIDLPLTQDGPIISTVVYPAGQPHVVHPSHLTLPVMEADFSLQGIHALIGRDILAHCYLAYDGRNGRFTLTYGNP
jgi:hypothetical protein